MGTKKQTSKNGKLKIRGGKEIVKDIEDAEPKKKFIVENPIKRQIKINQFPWTDKQKDFFRIALDYNTKIVFVGGPAGTAKTLLATYCGLQLLNMKSISDILYLRSAVESADRSLGFLPGNADEKLRFYNLPLIDKLEELLAETKPEKLEDEHRVSMFPVNFARGMNWKGKCIILDEAQNSTEKEILTVLTRMGEGSRCFVLADPMQTDLKSENARGGFEGLSHIFSDEESVNMGVYSFEFSEEDIMRSELVKFIIKKLQSLAEEK